MSLRLRLTLLYSSVLGGVLMIAGTMVYALVSVFLLNQVNNTLNRSAEEIINNLKVNASNQFDSRSIIKYQPEDNISFQVWGNNRSLQLSYPASQTTPLDEAGLWSGRQIIETTNDQLRNMRVLSIPLKTERGPVGVLQVGFNLALIDITRRTLATVLVMLILFAMLLTGLAAWLLTARALAPLSTVIQIATKITKADDLQRRIPLSGPPDDEVGQLIQAFNQTLERLEQLFNTQRRFLADVSHELRTPLTVIKGNVGLIRRLGETDEESLRSIETEVDRLTRLVGDLLLLAQAESGRLPLNMNPISLDTLLLEVFQQMQTLAGDRIKLKIVEIDQVMINADQDRIKQVFVNLISNAIHYTSRGGEIKIALSKKNHQALIEISDNGPGIPEEDLPHIFERFYRGEKSRTRSKGSGFGLGLSIVYWIVTNHQGSIEVKSKEGEGTTFLVWLPAID